MCLNGHCFDQCIYNNKCAPEAQCRRINHQIECHCPAGLTGDPTIACIEKLLPVCHSDYDCDVDYACMDGLCQKPCQVLDSCQKPTVCQLVTTHPLKSMTCTCPTHMITSIQGQCVDCKHNLFLLAAYRYTLQELPTLVIVIMSVSFHD